MISPYSLTIDEVAKQLGADLERGLSAGEVSSRVDQFGPNQLDEPPAVSIWHRLAAQFTDIVIWILIVGAVVSGLLGEWIDAIAIFAIILLNAFISFFQEMRAEQAISALRKLSTPSAKVVRDQLLRSIPAKELVPGDVIELEAGDHIPADARLFVAFGLTVQEAALTGESLPTEKVADIALPSDVPVGDRKNMVHMGTVVAAGKGRGLVTATGMQTELGHIANLLEQQKPEPTPLQRRLAELGRVLVVVCLGIVALIFVLHLLRGGSLTEAFMMAVSLSVAAVPEGLPAVVTISLALGLQRMVKRNALVRNLPSVETLGTVTVICSDKTGTLTKNEMTVQKVWAGGESYSVTGIGYIPEGEFHRFTAGSDQGETTPVEGDQSTEELDLALRIGAWCNNSEVVPPKNETGDWTVVGDPTEGSLIVAAMKRRIELRSKSMPIKLELPFDSTRKLMSVLIHEETGELVLYTKGAPESVLQQSRSEQRAGLITELTDERRREILAANGAMAHEALRVLGVAYRTNVPKIDSDELERDLIFVGLIGMMDPPRDEAKDAVRQCLSAGIRPVMITGDHPETASAIASKLGILTDASQAIAASKIEHLSTDALSAMVERIAVYARASAEHKLRIVEALQSRGDVVAMTGDGVNDAPAIKAADIGIAMGITGTDVTKEASDMVLTDDNFVSIVAAVEEGRGIYDNIQKVLLFLLSCNAGEIMLMLAASLLGWPIPLLPVQLLWINLVTDGLPALALSLEAPEPGIMRRKPRAKREAILDVGTGASVLLQGLLVGSAAFIAFWISYRTYPENVERSQAMTFCVLVYAELLRAMSARSRTIPLFRLGLFSNPYLLVAVAVSGMLQLSLTVLPFAKDVFRVPPFSGSDWLAIVLLSLMPFGVMEGMKWLTSIRVQNGVMPKPNVA